MSITGGLYVCGNMKSFFHSLYYFLWSFFFSARVESSVFTDKLTCRKTNVASFQCLGPKPHSIMRASTATVEQWWTAFGLLCLSHPHAPHTTVSSSYFTRKCYNPAVIFNFGSTVWWAGQQSRIEPKYHKPKIERFQRPMAFFHC